MSIAYLLSGSNQGDRAGYLQSAATYLRKDAGELLECSDLYESASWGFDHPSPFLNQAIKIKTDLTPQKLLEVLHGIETLCGRDRKGDDEYDARTLDIDILFFDELVMESRDLTLPHPRIHLRRFALKPLAAIAPDFVHPVLEKSIGLLLEECSDDGVVMKFKECRCCFKREEGNEI